MPRGAKDEDERRPLLASSDERAWSHAYAATSGAGVLSPRQKMWSSVRSPSAGFTEVTALSPRVDKSNGVVDATQRRRGGSDAVTYDTMMQLSVSRNPLRHESFRSFVIWLVTSSVLFLTNQLTTLPVGFFPAYAQQTLHMTSLQLSVFFSLYPLCIMVSSPLAAFASPVVGRQTIICLGMIVSGSTTIAFAYTTSISAVFILRVCQGLGAGAAGEVLLPLKACWPLSF
jgi:Na+/melibiose symporter-like transporter